ncbi:MAG: malonate decarboxylase acyl carrier protein [Arcobacter sp.]|nr:MAG: malonate decarboxylase acyl carrier protein [Arcobacter sp.]
MEHLTFEYEEGKHSYDAKATIVGVVASGNLEVLIEKNDSGLCSCKVITSEIGFKNIWQAVLNDFFEKYELKNTDILINDSGASPSVVSLRLDQAMEKYKRSAND